MSNLYLFIAVAVIAGAMMPAQAAVNNRLAIAVDSPVLASLVSFVVGTAALLGYILLAGVPLSNLASPRSAPAIAWTGGLLGAFFVAASVSILPRLGVALTFSLIVAGQMAFTLVIDHFGLLGVEVRPISVLRVAGVSLIIAGVVLIRRF